MYNLTEKERDITQWNAVADSKEVEGVIILLCYAEILTQEWCQMMVYICGLSDDWSPDHPKFATCLDLPLVKCKPIYHYFLTVLHKIS